MLRQLRSEKFKKVLLYALLLIVVPSFVVFYGWQQGGGTGSQDMVTTPAKVKFGPLDKVDVTTHDISIARRMLRARYDAYERMTGVKVDPAILDRLMDNRQLIDAAVEMKIWENLARESGVHVSQEDALRRIGEQFPTRQHREFLTQQLRQQGLSLEEFVNLERIQMQEGLARQTIMSSARASFFEAWLDYAARNEKLVAESVRLDVADQAAKVEVDDKVLSEFFQANINKFTIPDRVEFRYILVNKDDLRTSVTVADDDVTSYYMANLDAYRIPDATEVRQILLNIPPARPDESEDAHTTAVQQVRDRAQEIFNRISKGEDFEAVADEVNEEMFFPPRQSGSADAESTAGGYLGFIARNDAKTYYGDDWTSAVFTANNGDLLGPVNIDRAFAIVKVGERRESVVQPLDTVRGMVVERVRDEMVEPLFEAVRKELEENSSSITDIAKLAEATTQTLRTAPRVDKDAPFVPGIGLLGEFQEALTILERGGRSDVLADNSRILVVELLEEFPSHTPELAEVRDRVEAGYRNEKGREKAGEIAEQIKARATTPDAFRTAVADAGLTTTLSSEFTRSDFARVLGPVVDFEETIQGLKENQVVLSPTGSADQPNGFALWLISRRVPPSREDYAKELNTTMGSLASRKAAVLMNEYMRDRKAALGDRIEIHPAFR